MTQNWNYRPLSEEFKMNAIALVVTAETVGGLSFVFNPLAVGAAVAFGIGVLGLGVLLGRIKPRQNPNWKKFEEIVPADKKKEFELLVSQIGAMTRQMNLPEMQLYADIQEAASINNNPEMPMAYDPPLNHAGYNVVGDQLLLPISVLWHLETPEHKAIIAHELSHRKTNDHISPPLIVDRALSRTVFSMGVLCGIDCFQFLVSGAQILSSFPPIVCAAVLLAGKLVQTLGGKKIGRIQELRADRNGMYTLGDYSVAMEPIKDIRLYERFAEISRIGSVSRFFGLFDHPWFNSHPSADIREKNLRISWPHVMDAYEAEGRAHQLKLA